MSGPLLLIGCGKMGGAMLDGWLARGLAANGVWVVEPFTDAVARFQGVEGVSLVADVAGVPEDVVPSVVLLAVKPQTMDEAIAPLGRFVAPETVFLSIAAGKSIGYFEGHLGDEARIVRAMPNTPAAVGRGITAYVPNGSVSSAQAEACGALLEAIGEAVAIDDEGLMDAVTAVSGSGPAYVFHLIETLAAAGVSAGLPEDLSARLARATVAGAGELARQSSDPASQLRVNVTSPGGTTAAALAVLMEEAGGLQALMTEAVQAATDRSRELAG